MAPDAQVRSQLAQAASLTPPGDAPNAGRVKPERYHLTIEFLGELEAPRIEAAVRAGDAVESPAFDLRLNTIGHFTGVNVAWIGPAQCPLLLTALKAALGRELLHFGLPVAGEMSVPHIICLRSIREASDAPAPEIDWSVDDFALVRNSSASGRSHSAVLKRWALTS